MKNNKHDLEGTVLNGEDAETIRVDWNRYEQPILAIIETIAAVEGKQPTNLPPLGARLEVDALTALLEGNEADNELTVSFQYQGFNVTICGSGELIVEPVIN